MMHVPRLTSVIRTTAMQNVTKLAELVAQLLMLLTAGFATLAGAFSPALVAVLAWMSL